MKSKTMYYSDYDDETKYPSKNRAKNAEIMEELRNIFNLKFPGLINDNLITKNTMYDFIIDKFDEIKDTIEEERQLTNLDKE